MMHLWIWVLLGLTALLIFLFYSADRCLNLIVHPVRCTKEDVFREDAAHHLEKGFTAYETAWNHEPFTVLSGGAEISCEHIPCPANAGKEKKQFIIICHGHTVNRYSSLKYAEIFYRLGFDLILFDERYFGDSGGSFCTLGQEETKDLANIIDTVHQRYGEKILLGLHGESMGGAIVLLELAQRPVDFVIADCPFAAADDLLQECLRAKIHLPQWPLYPLFAYLADKKYGFKVHTVNPIEAVHNSTVPICFMHGAQDSLISCMHSIRMYNETKNPVSELHLFKKADHACSIVVDPQGYEDTLKTFLARCGIFYKE
jgi:pimeloyl-ACP methyl ester carboxylesterase